MENFGAPLWLILLLVIVVLVVIYVRYMSATHDTFKKLGIDTPPVTMVLGHFHLLAKFGMFRTQMEWYSYFKGKKVYGIYEVRKPQLILRDVSLVKEILVKHSSKFPNRSVIPQVEPLFQHTLFLLKDEHWKRVRSAVSPTFTSGRLKRMVPHIQRNASILVDSIRQKQERNEQIELKDTLAHFTLDMIASTAFGYDISSQKNPDGKFVTHMKKLQANNPVADFLVLFFPPLVKILKMCHIYTFPKESMDFFDDFVDAALVDRRQSWSAKTAEDFLDLVASAEQLPSHGSLEYSPAYVKSANGGSSGLSRQEIQAQARTFVSAGTETVAIATSFTIFMLANNPMCLRKLQEEIDANLGKQPANLDNVQSLHYLDMCISETLRMYPPAPFVDRVCSEDVDIEGIHIPKGMVVVVPTYAIHHDPDIWSNPYQFDPDRFSRENKETRSPYAHLPFGHGPRSCIGMRLGLLETKLAVVTVLQSFTPVPCDKQCIQ